MTLPSFPGARGDWLRAPAKLLAQGMALRPAGDADLPFLRVLYAQTRAAELAPVPWPAEFKQKFLDDQFDLQHRHYTRFFGRADFLLIEKEGDPLGRLYLLRDAPDFHVVDIALLETARNQGIAGALITHVQASAVADGLGVTLHVDRRNAGARRLYERLGFIALDGEGEHASHLAMRWPATQWKTA